MSAYIQWTTKSGATLQLFFDAVISEAQELTAELTEHPVEVGANITDHVREQLDHVRLEVFVSNEPAQDVNNRGMGPETVLLEIPDLPDPPLLSIGGLMSRISTMLQSAPERNASVFKFGDEFDAVSDTLAILQELKGKQLLDVMTPARDYHNMILRSISLKRSADTGTGGSFDLEFQQIRLVETKIVKAPIPTESRGQPTVNKGAQGPKPAKDQGKKKSVLKSLLDKVLK